MRVHGTTAQRPLEMFTELEASCLLPVPEPYDQPIFTRVKVHRDYHVEVARGLYSIPEHLIGSHLEARADSELVRFYSTGSAGGKLVKTHPRQSPGGRSTDPKDLPAEKAGYALRDLSRLVAICTGHEANVGIYAERLLDDPLPWARMRAVSAARVGPPLRTRPGRGGVRAVVGPGRSQRVQDRRHAGQSYRTAPAGTARRGRSQPPNPRRPVRPRPRRIQPCPSCSAHPHPRRRDR